MTCVVTTENGRTVFACSRGPWPGTVAPKCQRCGKRNAQFECDFPDATHSSGTCDLRLCNHRDCLATRWKGSERVDYCRAHVEQPVAP